ncbi:MAG: hypothetical protein LBT00_03965 [Spirochaetaceae bacterium]|jgi:hypothetical protein|nr:hypothetical protein [Spirochaetaceae bacterium]
MKKVFSILTVAVILATAAWAQDFSISAGGGGLLAGDGLLVGDFAGGFKKGGDKTTYPYIGGGGFVYVDATYAELSVGFLVGSGDVESDSGNTPWTLSSLNLGLLGKFPFALSDALTIFPAAGIEYQRVLSAKKDGKEVDEPGDYSALWIKAGAGLDVRFAERFYFRGEVLFGIRLANKAEKDEADSGDGETVLGLGPTVKLGVGYRF